MDTTQAATVAGRGEATAGTGMFCWSRGIAAGGRQVQALHIFLLVVVVLITTAKGRRHGWTCEHETRLSGNKNIKGLHSLSTVSQGAVFMALNSTQADSPSHVHGDRLLDRQQMPSCSGRVRMGLFGGCPSKSSHHRTCPTSVWTGPLDCTFDTPR